MATARPISVLALDIDGVFTDGRVTYAADGREQKALFMRDIDAVFAAKRQGIEVALVTGEDTPWVDFISRRLEVGHTIRGAKDKLAALHELARALKVDLSAVCYVGDADRDAPALAAVGLGMAPSDGSALARAAAHVVLKSEGGRGAVHEATSYLLEGGQRPPEPARATGGPAAPSGGMDVEESARQVSEAVAESVAVKRAVGRHLAPDIARAADAIAGAIGGGHKLLTFGNGGSAADAQHFAAELVGRFERERRGFAAVALTTDTSVLTALGNDYGVERVFARQVEALARPGDVAVAISTSGESRNVLEGAKAAAGIPVYTIGLTGRTGGALGGAVDLCIRVPSERTARIQEAHGLIIHIISGLVESHLTGREPAAGHGAP